MARLAYERLTLAARAEGRLSRGLRHLGGLRPRPARSGLQPAHAALLRSTEPMWRPRDGLASMPSQQTPLCPKVSLLRLS